MKPITTLDDEIVQTSWPGPVTTRLRPVVCRVDPDGRLYARWRGEDGYVGEEQPFPNWLPGSPVGRRVEVLVVDDVEGETRFVSFEEGFQEAILSGARFESKPRTVVQFFDPYSGEWS